LLYGTIIDPLVRRGNDVNDDNLGENMNKQVPLEELSPIKAKLNYN
jgi:hypothetical protein